MVEKAYRAHLGWNLIGLTRHLLLPYFPQRLSGLSFAIATTPADLLRINARDFTIAFVDEGRPENTATLNCNFSATLITGRNDSGTEISSGSMSTPTEGVAAGQTSDLHWTTFTQSPDDPTAIETVVLNAPPLWLTEPTNVTVLVKFGEESWKIGSFSSAHFQPPPLSTEEIRAIRSRPGGADLVVFTLGCKRCGDKQRVHTVLDSEVDPKKIPDGSVLLANHADSWKCKCGNSNLSLTFLKAGAHELFRRPPIAENDHADLSLVGIYQVGRLAQIANQYLELIASAPREEEVQKFLECNPVLWSFLSPLRILHKPKVLTKKEADFAILSPNKVLNVIEIEKPSTPLFTKKGKVSEKIQLGFDQVRDWQLVVENHRHAFLSELDFKDDDVHDIRYLVIGGLAKSNSPENLSKIRRVPPAPKTEFLCFDELAGFLHVVQTGMTRA